MTENLILFTITPVQKFITTARKTEDLWLGSYICLISTQPQSIRFTRKMESASSTRQLKTFRHLNSGKARILRFRPFQTFFSL